MAMMFGSAIVWIIFQFSVGGGHVDQALQVLFRAASHLHSGFATEMDTEYHNQWNPVGLALPQMKEALRPKSVHTVLPPLCYHL